MLFKKKCPLPTCEIRKMHRHLLIFKDLDSPRDKRKKERQKARDERKLAKDSLKRKQILSDTASSGESKPTYYEVDDLILDDEGNEYVDEKEQRRRDRAKAKLERKKARKAAKKERLAKKGQLSKEDLLESDTTDLGEDDNPYFGLTEQEYKEKRLEESNLGPTENGNGEIDEKVLARQVRKEDRATRKIERKKERAARKKKKVESDFTKLYRSRVTKWWRRNQNPKTGKYFKRRNLKTRVG